MSTDQYQWDCWSVPEQTQCNGPSGVYPKKPFHFSQRLCVDQVFNLLRLCLLGSFGLFLTACSHDPSCKQHVTDYDVSKLESEVVAIDKGTIAHTIYIFPGPTKKAPLVLLMHEEADVATKYAFRAGRRFSTFFERERDTGRRNVTMTRDEIIDEEDANTTAVGHFGPYITHDLRAGPCPNQRSEGQDTRTTVGDPAVAMLQGYDERSRAWEEDKPGSNIEFKEHYTSCLKRNDSTAGRNPNMDVRVDGEIIKNHGDVDNPRMIEFIKQLILLSSQPWKLDERKKGRENVRLLLQ
jgi:hypothetical protein